MTEAERIEKELKDAVIGQEQLALDLVRALDLNKSLEDQIEYQNKSAKEDHDKISKLEFELKSAHELNRELMGAVKSLLEMLQPFENMEALGPLESFRMREIQSLINKAK